MTQDLTIREPSLTPAEVVENATTQAKLLMTIVEQTHCYQKIGDKKYLQVEAWETIGAFNRVHAETKEVQPIIQGEETIGYQATVQLWKDGNVVGGASMPCYFSENCCKGKSGDAKHKAAMSAAQTFAESKAFRMTFSYVAILAGYQPTPAEEMSDEEKTEAGRESRTGTPSEHFCKAHNTNWFKSKNMKSYAHPIEGTEPTQWCYESPEKPSQAPVAGKDTTEPKKAGNVPEQTPIQRLLMWTLSHGKTYDATWVCKQVGVNSTLEITDFPKTYATLKEITGWND